MNVTSRKIKDLTPSPHNPRRHSDRQVEEMIRSLDQFGQYRPLVIDEDGVVLAGNGLLQALIQRGDTTASVHEVKDLSEGQKRKLMVVDNRLSDMGVDDYDALQEVLRTLDDFNVPGYDEQALRDLLSDTETFLEDASNYGVLPPEGIDAANKRGERIAEADEQARVGQPPAPLPDSGSESGVDADEDLTDGHPSVCPTCGQQWL